MGGQATFKQLFTVYIHAGVVLAASQVFLGPLNYFRQSMTGATNLAVLLPMLDDQSFIGRLFGMIDLFWIWWMVVLVDWPRRPLQAQDAIDRDGPVRVLCGRHHLHSGHHEHVWEKLS